MNQLIHNTVRFDSKNITFLPSLTDCDIGKYGIGCSKTCGVCLNNETCYHINGTCLRGCAPGYKGIECTDGCNIKSRAKLHFCIIILLSLKKIPKSNLNIDASIHMNFRL